jgi:DNA-directed RNA polymerase subunit RPC12/RpoP
MSEVSSFFRHCPSCGRRFHIKLVSKKLVDVKRETVEKKVVNPSAISAMGGSVFGAPSTFAPVLLQYSIPAEVDIEDFQYQYKCSHCGHEWSENRIEESKE